SASTPQPRAMTTRGTRSAPVTSTSAATPSTARRSDCDSTMTGATRAEICVDAVAEAFRGDGEILANPIGNVPMIGGRLARTAFEPDLVMTDGEALLIAGPYPVGATDEAKTIEAWNPYRSMFDIVWSGRRHVIMGGKIGRAS